MTNAIDVRNLTKRFGKKTAVNGIDIAVPEGQVWGFLGPNGSGKTTTIRMLCGLLIADAGFEPRQGLFTACSRGGSVTQGFQDRAELANGPSKGAPKHPQKNAC